MNDNAHEHTGTSTAVTAELVEAIERVVDQSVARDGDCRHAQSVSLRHGQ